MSSSQNYGQKNPVTTSGGFSDQITEIIFMFAFKGIVEQFQNELPILFLMNVLRDNPNKFPKGI